MMINKLVRDIPRVFTASKTLWLLCVVLLFAVNAFSTITNETEESLKNEVDSIKNELTRLKSEYNNLSTKLRKQDTHISVMEANMGKLKEDDADLKNELDNVKVNLLDSLIPLKVKSSGMFLQTEKKLNCAYNSGYSPYYGGCFFAHCILAAKKKT